MDTLNSVSVEETPQACSTTCITILHQADVASARVEGARLAERSEFGTHQRYCLTTSISELAHNILVHAQTGSITLAIIDRPGGGSGVQVVARDSGVGIEDIDLAMQDGYSTGAGLGGGLPGVRRLMSDLQISSTAGIGTVVRAVKWADDTSTDRGG